jgi:hypothetical protein
MIAFTVPGSIDIRDQLPRASWTIGWRTLTTSITVHYNGPAVAPNKQSGAGLIAQLRADCAWQMQAGWGNTVNGADGLMYHLVIAADGQVYQTRDMSALLWHCGHADGNTNGLAIQLPLGDDQDATPAQVQALFRTLDALRGAYPVPAQRVLGHLEWKHATLCPGPKIQPRVEAYRAGLAPVVQPTVVPANVTKYQVISTDNLNVRQGPGVEFPIAGTLKPGSVMYVDVLKSNGWAHMARVANEQADLGFCALQYLKAV